MIPIEAQKECKKRFPIGCEYKCALEGNGDNFEILEDDNDTYRIYPLVDNFQIWAHSGGGILYDSSSKKWAISKSIPAKPKKDDLKPLIKLLKCIK